MLPLYTNENVHQRHGGVGPAWGPRASSSPPGTPLALHGPGHKGGRRQLVRLVAQVALIICVLLPLWLLASDHFTGSSNGSGAGADAASDHPLLTRDASTSSSSSSSSSGSSRQQQHELNRKLLDDSPAGYFAHEPLKAAYLTNLVLVAGHAVYVGRDYREAGLESSWFLEDYQQVPGEAQSFVDHIGLGVAEAARDPGAMLLFSGGQTRRAAGPRSEGMSYWVVAEAANWFNTTGVRNRTFTEEHARDSFENLLFSMCRFYELTGHYPARVTVVSYNLKRERFSGLHREALRFPAHRFKFVGTDVPPAAVGAEEGEARTVAAFKRNPYGCDGELQAKRLRRDPFAVGPPHPSRCPDMRDMLTYCGTELYDGLVPWTDDGLALRGSSSSSSS